MDALGKPSHFQARAVSFREGIEKHIDIQHFFHLEHYRNPQPAAQAMHPEASATHRHREALGDPDRLVSGWFRALGIFDLPVLCFMFD